MSVLRQFTFRYTFKLRIALSCIFRRRGNQIENSVHLLYGGKEILTVVRRVDTKALDNLEAARTCQIFLLDRLSRVVSK